MEQVVLAEVVRSGVVEGRHRGSAVALGVDGSTTYAAGDVTTPVLPRSCNKPLQALGMVRLGLDLPPDLLALACASHSGEGFHVDGVRRILATQGLDEDLLRTPEDWPFDPVERDAVLRAGGEASRVLMNCSGKHAAMLVTCAVNGWDTATYLDPAHPLQQALATTYADMTGETVEPLATDGCGAPIFSASLTGLARAFGRLAAAPDGPERRVADAMRAHPEMVSGTRRDERALMDAVPGAIVKLGAESCYVVALSDGRAFALKHEDGGDRARPVTMAALLEQVGVTGEAGVDAEAVRATGRLVLLGGGLPVGEVRATLR